MTEHDKAIQERCTAGFKQRLEPVAWRVRGYAQFKKGKPGPWSFFHGPTKPRVNTPDACDIEPLYAAPYVPEQAGEVVVTKNEDGAIVAVTRQDEEGRILSVIAESSPQAPERTQDAKDAALYRWLKTSNWYVGPSSFYCGEGGKMIDYDDQNGIELDAAIAASREGSTQP